MTKPILIRDDERAVSPVIGVILMVAITVILAAVIGAFVLDLGSNQDQNVNAGVSFDSDGSGTVTVQVTDMGNADTIKVESDNGNVVTSPLSSVGDSTEVQSLNDGNQITVIAVSGGNENVINTYTYDG